MDSNQILHNNKDHQVLFVGAPKMTPTHARWWMATILKIHNISATDYDEIWHGDASGDFAPNQPLKFSEFKIPRWQINAIVKNRKMVISLQPLD